MVYVLVVTVMTIYGPYERAFEANSLRHCIAAAVPMKKHYEMRFDEPIFVDCVKRSKAQ